MENKKKKNFEIVRQVIIVFVCFISILCIVMLSLDLLDMQKNNFKSNKIVLFHTLSSESINSALNSVNHYSNALSYYDTKDYDLVIIECETSRTYSSEHVSETREMRSIYNSIDDYDLEITKEIDKIVNDMIDEEIKMYNALYESCEYLESASRNIQNLQTTDASINIQASNEKINVYDKSANEFNEKLSQFRVLSKEVLKESQEEWLN